MTAQPIQQIGPYARGEVPQVITITMQDADGNALDLTGFTADFIIEAVGQTVTGLGTGVAVISSPETNGITTYSWVAADVGTIGTFRAQMWVNDAGDRRFASEVFQFDVEEITVNPF